MTMMTARQTRTRIQVQILQQEKIIKHNNNNSNYLLQRQETFPGGRSSPHPTNQLVITIIIIIVIVIKWVGWLIHFFFIVVELGTLFFISEKKLSINLELLRFDPCLVPLWRSPPWREARRLALN